MPQTPQTDISNAASDNDAPLTQKEKANLRAAKWFQDNRQRRRTYIQSWNAQHLDKCRSYQTKYKRNLRSGAIDAYSNGTRKCACCGETLWEFLCIDHIHGGGNAHRKSLGVRGGHRFYQWLKNNNYPPGYRVLCYNCNFALGMWHYCPHHNLPEDHIPESKILPL